MDEEDWEDIPGLLGHGEGVLQLKTPTRLPSLLGGERAIGVAASFYFSLATLSTNGALWSWGCGYSGQLGHGDTQHQLLPKKIEAFADQRVVAVSTGDGHSLAITADGAIYQLLPKKVEALAGQRVVALSAAGVHSLAITADGAVWSWGAGGLGRLGHGEDLSNQLLPKKIEVWSQE